MLNTKALYKKILHLSIPIVLSQLLDSAVTMADIVMTNYVGQEALSASSLAGQFCSIAFMIFFGIDAGAIMLGSQYWGRSDLKTIQSVQGIALRYSTFFGVLLSAAFLAIPKQLMRLYTPDPELIRLGAVYLRILAPGILCWSVSTVFSASLQTVERVSECTFLKFLTLGSNVFLNAVFIFGLFGAPKMGIAGIALATSVSKFIELGVCVLISIRSKNIKLHLRGIFEKNPVLKKDFVSMAIPAAANDILWGLAFSVYPAIYGRLGSDVVAANSIVSVIRNLGAVLCFSIGSVTGLVLGQYLGRDEIAEAKAASRHFLRLALLTGAAGGLMIFVLKKPVLAFANVSEQSLEYLAFMLNVNCFYIMGTAVNTTLITGVFRAGGDSRFGLICDTVDMWGYAVPVGLLAAFVFKFPVRIVYLLLCTDEFVKWPWVFRHYYSGKWARNITHDSSFLND